VLLEPNSGSGGLAVGGASVVVACGCAAGPRGVEISGLLVREGLSVIAGGRNEAIGAGDGVLAAESEVRFEAVVTEAGDVSFRSGWFEISLEAGGRFSEYRRLAAVLREFWQRRIVLDCDQWNWGPRSDG